MDTDMMMPPNLGNPFDYVADDFMGGVIDNTLSKVKSNTSNVSPINPIPRNDITSRVPLKTNISEIFKNNNTLKNNNSIFAGIGSQRNNNDNAKNGEANVMFGNSIPNFDEMHDAFYGAFSGDNSDLNQMTKLRSFSKFEEGFPQIGG